MMMYLEPFLTASAVIFGGMTLLWLLSARLKDVSIVDIVWGTAFVVSAWVYALPAPGRDALPALSGQQWLLLAVVTIWGLRLSLHIFLRNRGHDEDRRYVEMRERNDPGWWWKSLFFVFYLQGALVLIIGAPLLMALAPTLSTDWHWSVVPGALVWLIGFTFEAGGDYQLQRFKSDPSNRGQVLDVGLWRYTRHPNYFGDATQWFGFWIMSWCAPLGPWTFFAPVIMTLFIIKISGVALLEKDISERRPAYRAYIERTNAFFPGPPKSSGDAS